MFKDTKVLSATVESPGALVVSEKVYTVPLFETDGLVFALMPDLVFGQPLMITLNYLDVVIAGMVEAALILYYYVYVTRTWVDVNPCGGYLRDIENYFCGFEFVIFVIMPCLIGQVRISFRTQR